MVEPSCEPDTNRLFANFPLNHTQRAVFRLNGVASFAGAAQRCFLTRVAHDLRFSAATHESAAALNFSRLHSRERICGPEHDQRDSKHHRKYQSKQEKTNEFQSARLYGDVR